MNLDLTSDNAQGLDDSGTSPEILDSTVSRIWYSVSSVPGLFWNVLCWQLNPLMKLYYVIVTSLDGSRGKQRKLLCWLEAMSGREVRDLQAVWEDGSIVCDIINAVMVGNCEPKDHHGNCLRHAQELASHHFKLLPVFSNSELQKPFNPSFEKRLWRYLLALRNALKLRLANNMADQDEKDPEYLIAEEYVARGMGLILASRGERAIFFIYSRDDSSLADIHIDIKGPNGDCGEATAGEPIDSEHHSIAIDYRLTPDYLKVCYIPNSLGRHELSLTRYGFNIPGSPFIIKVGEHTGPPAEKFSYLDWLTEEQEEEQRLEIDRKRKLKVVSRVIDFITEKMHMTEDGQLVKMENSSLKVPSPAPYNLKRTGRSLSPRPRCKLSSQKRSKSLTNQKLIQAAEFFKFSKEEKKCVQDAASQVSEDFSMIHPVGIDQFQEKCQRIVRACDFLLSHAPKQKSLEILTTAEKILDIPYNNTLTHHKSSFELYRSDIDNCNPDINLQNVTTESSRSSETDDEKEVIKPYKPEINVTRVDFSDRLYSMRRFDDVGLNAVSSFSTSSTANENISTPQVNWEEDRSKSTSPQKDARIARKSFQTVGYTKAKRSSQTSLPTNNISDDILLSDNKNDNLEGNSIDNVGDEMCVSDDKNVNIEENSTNSNISDGVCLSDYREDNTEENKENKHNYIGEDENLHNITALETNDCSEKNEQEEINFEHTSTRLSRSREPKITRNSKSAKTVSNLVKQFENKPVCSSVLSVRNELPINVETNSGENIIDNSVKPSLESDDSNKNNCGMMEESLKTEINNDEVEIKSSEIDEKLNKKTGEIRENVPEAEIYVPEQSIMPDELSQSTCDKVEKNIKSSTGEQNVIIDEQNIINYEQNMIIDEQNIINYEQNIIIDEQNIIIDEQNMIIDEQNVINYEQNIIIDEQIKRVDEIDEKTNKSVINISVETINEGEGEEDTNAQDRKNNSIQDSGSLLKVEKRSDTNNLTRQESKDENEALVESTPELDVGNGVQEDNTETKLLEGSCFKEDVQVISSIKSRISAFEEYSRKSEKDSLLNKNSRKGEGVSRFGKIVTSTGDGKVEVDNGRDSTVKIYSKHLENIESPNELPVVINIFNKAEEDMMETVNNEKSNNVKELSNSNYVEEVEKNKNEDAKDGETVVDEKYSEIIQEISNSNANKQVEDLVECSDKNSEAKIKSETDLTLANSVQNVMEESSPTLLASNEECVLLSVKNVSFDGEPSTKDVGEPAFEKLKHSEIDETAFSDEETSIKENEIVILLEDEKLVENSELNHFENSVEPEQVPEPDNVVNRDDILESNKNQDNKDIVIELPVPPSSVPDCSTEEESTTFENENDRVSYDNLNPLTEEDPKLGENIENVDSNLPLLTEQITAAPSDADIVKLIGGEAEVPHTPPEDKTEKKKHKVAEVLKTSKIDSYTVLEKNSGDFIDVKEQPIIFDEEMNVSSCDIEAVDKYNNLSTGENEVILRNKLIDANVVPEIILKGDDVEESSNNQMKTDESVVSLSKNFAMEDNENISSASHEIVTNTIGIVTATLGIVTATLGIVTNENQKSHIGEKFGHENKNLSVNIFGVEELEKSLENVCEASHVDGNLEIEASLECSNTIISGNPECNVNSTTVKNEIVIERGSDDNKIDRELDNEHRAIESKIDDIVNETNGTNVNDGFDSQNTEIHDKANKKNREFDPDVTSNTDVSDVDHSLITETANFKQQEIISSESDALNNDNLNEKMINIDNVEQNLESPVSIENKVIDDSNKVLEVDNSVEDMNLSGEKILSDLNMDNKAVENLNYVEKNNDCLEEDVERSVEMPVIDEQNSFQMSENIINETEEEKSDRRDYIDTEIQSSPLISEESKTNSSHGIENDILTDSDIQEVSDHMMVITPDEIATKLDNLESDKGQILNETIAEENILENNKLSIHPLETEDLDKNECLIEGDAVGENAVSVENNDVLLDNVTSTMAEINIGKNIKQGSKIILDLAYDIDTKSAEVEQDDSNKTNAEDFSKNTTADEPVEKELLVSNDTKIVDSNHEEIILGDHDRTESVLNVSVSQGEKAEINAAEVDEGLISVNDEGQSIQKPSALEALTDDEGGISGNIKQFEEPPIEVTAQDDVVVENIPTVVQSSETSKFEKEIPEVTLEEQKENYFEAENRIEDLIDGTKTPEISVANELPIIEEYCSNHEESNLLDQFTDTNKIEEVEEILEEGEKVEERTSDNKFEVDEGSPESEDDRNKINNGTGVTEIIDEYSAKENFKYEDIGLVDQKASIIDEHDTIEKSVLNHSCIVKEEIPSDENSLPLKVDTIIESCVDSSNIESCATKNDKLFVISGADDKCLLEQFDRSSENTQSSSATDNYLLKENIISDISEATVLTEDHVAQTFEFDTDNTGTKDKILVNLDPSPSKITIEIDNNNDKTGLINSAECSLENQKSNDIEDGSHIVENEIEIDQHLENNADKLIESNELLVTAGLEENKLFQLDHNSELNVPSTERSEEAEDKEYINENEKDIEPVGDDNKISRDENELLMKADSESEILITEITGEESDNSFLVKDGEIKEAVEDVSGLGRKEITEESVSENALGVLETSGDDKCNENMEDINCQKNLDELAENLCNISAKMKVEQEFQDIINEEDKSFDKIGYESKPVEINIAKVDCESIDTENCIQQNEIENKIEITGDLSLVIDTSTLEDNAGGSSDDKLEKIIDSATIEQENVIEISRNIQKNKIQSQTIREVIDTSTEKGFQDNLEVDLESSQLNEVHISLNETTVKQNLLENILKYDIESNLESSRDEKIVIETNEVNECGNSEVEMEDNISLDNLYRNVNSNLQNIVDINNDQLLVEVDQEASSELEMNVYDPVVDKKSNIENCSRDNDEKVKISSGNLEESSPITIIVNDGEENDEKLIISSGSEQSIPILIVNVEDESVVSDKSTQMIDGNEKLEEVDKISIYLFKENIDDTCTKTEDPLDIPEGGQHVKSSVDIEKQIEVDNEGILIGSITMSNEHGLNTEVEFEENTISEEVVRESSRENKEDSLKHESLSDKNSIENIISDVSIPTTGEKIEIFNDKESKINEMDSSNQPLLTIDDENISNDSQNIIQYKLIENIGNCQIESLSEVGLSLKNDIQELKTAKDVIFSDEPISLIENYDLIESSQPNEGLFDKELVDDLDLSLDGVNRNYNDAIIVEKQFETGENKLDHQTEILEKKSETGLIKSEIIQNKSVEQVLQAEEKILESIIISDETAMDNLINIDQTASAEIGIVLSTSKDENSTGFKICGDESVVLDEKMQNEDSKQMFCDKIMENNTSINFDEVVSSNDAVDTNLEMIDANISKKEAEESTTLSCNMQIPVIDIMSVDNSIGTVTNELTENFESENQQNNSTEKDSNNIIDADLLQDNESVIDKITENNTCQLEMFEKQSEGSEMNTNMTEEELGAVENDEKIKEEFKNEDGKEINTNMAEEELKTIKSNESIQDEFENEEINEDEDLEIIDIRNDYSIPVHEKPAAHETTVESSLEVECIRNESPSSFQLSELSLGRQETFLLVNSPKKDSSTCDKTKKSGVKGLIEKFSNEISTTYEEDETIAESVIVQCEPFCETLGVFHEGDGSQPDRNNKLSKLVQRYETNIVDEIQNNALATNEKLVRLDNYVEWNKNIEIIEKKVEEDKETIDNTIFKDFEFDPTSIPTILTDVIPDEESNGKDENFPSQHEFDLCSIGSHDDDVVSKSYTDINDDSNESLTKNENFGSTEHLLLCVEGMEDDRIEQTVNDEGKSNQNESINSNNNYDKIISENNEALIHEDQSSFAELTEIKNHEIDHNKSKIDSIDMESSGEVIKRYGTSNDLLADLINEENMSQNEAEVVEKSLVSFVQIDDSMNLNEEEIVKGESELVDQVHHHLSNNLLEDSIIGENLDKNETEIGDRSLVSFLQIDDSINFNKEEIVNGESELVEHPLCTEDNDSVEEKSQHETLCIISNNSENTGEISDQKICVTQDDSLIIIEEQADLSQDTGIGIEVPNEVTLTPPPPVESHHTENVSVLNETDEIPAESRDVCYEILNEISTEKSKTEEDSLLKTSISDKQGTDSNGSELNRSISLIVNSSLESDFNLQDDGAQISECVLEVLMSNNENLESVEEPERDSIEDVLSSEAGEACVELEEKQVTEELAWLDKKSNELEEPASLSSFNLWPSNTVFGPSNEPNPTSELSEDIDFDSIISAPSLDEALKKFEKRLSDKMSKEKTSSMEETNETKGIEEEKVENDSKYDGIIMKNQDESCINIDNFQNESHMNASEIGLLLENKENDGGFITQEVKTMVDDTLIIDTGNSQKLPNLENQNGLQLDIEGSITQNIKTTDYNEPIVTENSQNESILNCGNNQLLVNDEGSIPIIETADNKELLINTGNSENESNSKNLLLENEKDNEVSILPSTEISVDDVIIIDGDNSQKESSSKIEIDLQVNDNKLIDIKNLSLTESNVNSDINLFLGNNESSVTPILEILDDKELRR